MALVQKTILTISQSMLWCINESLQTFAWRYILWQKEKNQDFFSRWNAYHKFLETYSIESYKLFSKQVPWNLDVLPDEKKREIVDENVGDLFITCMKEARKELEDQWLEDVDREAMYVWLMGKAYMTNKLPLAMVEEQLDEPLTEEIKKRWWALRWKLDEIDPENMCVYDHKTVNQRWSTVDIRKEIQAYVYAELFNACYGLYPKKMVYKVMMKPWAKKVGLVKSMIDFFESINYTVPTETNKNGKLKKPTGAQCEAALDKLGIRDDYKMYIYEECFDDIYREIEVEITEEFLQRMQPIVGSLIQDIKMIYDKYKWLTISPEIDGEEDKE